MSENLFDLKGFKLHEAYARIGKDEADVIVKKYDNLEMNFVPCSKETV